MKSLQTCPLFSHHRLKSQLRPENTICEGKGNLTFDLWVCDERWGQIWRRLVTTKTDGQRLYRLIIRIIIIQLFINRNDVVPFCETKVTLTSDLWPLNPTEVTEDVLRTGTDRRTKLLLETRLYRLIIRLIIIQLLIHCNEIVTLTFDLWPLNPTWFTEDVFEDRDRQRDKAIYRYETVQPIMIQLLINLSEIVMFCETRRSLTFDLWPLAFDR